MPNRESNPSNQELDELAARIRAALEAARQARSNALDHALQAGDALNAAQERVSSGWKRWLRTNCFLSPSTAMLYQQLARHRPEIEAKIEQIGELSLRSARRLVANPGGRKKKKSKPARQRLIAAWNQATDEDSIGSRPPATSVSPPPRSSPTIYIATVDQFAPRQSRLMWIRSTIS
jgi:hypothetical protein